MEPFAYLIIAKPFNKDRKEDDPAHIADVLEVQPSYSPWILSTEGHVQSSSVRAHVRWLLDTVGGYGALEPLQAEGYWPSVYFYDTTPPDPAEKEEVLLELEQHDITFDFELEREDFPR